MLKNESGVCVGAAADEMAATRHLRQLWQTRGGGSGIVGGIGNGVGGTVATMG